MSRFIFCWSLVGLASLLWVGCASMGQVGDRDGTGVSVRFVYTDRHARKVCLSGSFNDWSPQAHCMRREGELWAVDVRLAPGRYQYVFVVDDGVGLPDPGGVICEDNGFGGKNSVLVVE